MENYLKKNLFLVLFIFVPIFYLWNPNWIAFLGIQPYWPLFWLLPFSMVYGSTNGLIAGLFMGLTLDSISPDDSFTQIPGLILCGICFGRLGNCTNIFVEHFRHGLLCALGSFLCSSLYFSQILVKNIPDNNWLLYFPSIKNIFAQVFITALMAPFFCSKLLILFKRSKNRRNLLKM